MATDELVAVAYVSWGRWVADCPRLDCTASEMHGELDDGRDGGLTGDRFTCQARYGGCGLVAEVVWPARVDAITAVLAARPVPGTRNWRPPEVLVDLIAENLEHGVTVPDAVTGLVLAAASARVPIGV